MDGPDAPIEVTAPVPAYVPPPEPVPWTFDPPLRFEGNVYHQVLLRAPTAGEILQASAIPGSSRLDIMLRLISLVGAIQYEALKQAPAWMVTQMADYLDSFAGAPLPSPLQEWHRARLRT